MEWFNKYLFIGLGIGLVCALFAVIWVEIKKARESKESKKEIARLKAMLTDRMDLESEGLAKLKEGLAEMPRLQVYQQAADRLTINSPGFGAAWQSALKESEAEFKKTFLGLQPFIRKIIPSKNNANLIEDTTTIE